MKIISQSRETELVEYRHQLNGIQQNVFKPTLYAVKTEDVRRKPNTQNVKSDYALGGKKIS